MRKFGYLAVLLTPVLLLAVMAGCDSSGSSNNDLVPGDTTDAEYQFVSGILGDGLSETMNASISLTFDFWDSIPGATMAGKGSHQRLATQTDDVVVSEYSYSYGGGWHVFSFTGYVADFADTIDINGVDSVQFLVLGTPMQVPDSTVDELRIRLSFDMADRAGEISVAVNQSLDIDGITPSMLTPVTVSGSLTESLLATFADTASSCSLDMSTTVNVNNVQAVLSGDNCPTSGTLSAVAALEMSCTGSDDLALDVDGTWNLTAEFDGNLQHLTYSDGTTYWEVTEECNAPAATPFAHWFPRD